jgi:hypothetical protein
LWIGHNSLLRSLMAIASDRRLKWKTWHSAGVLAGGSACAWNGIGRELACYNPRLQKINVEPGEDSSARKEGKGQAQSRLDQLDKALSALTGVSGVGGSNEISGLAHRSGKRKAMSAAARKRIAAARRAHWAKWKAAQRTSKPNGTSFSTLRFTDISFSP